MGCTDLRMLVVAALLCVGGCAAREEQVVVPYHDIDFKPYIAKGTGVLRGQAFLRQNGGGIVSCAGEDVYLTPDVPYMREYFNVLKRGHEPTTPGRSGLGPYGKQAVRHTRCDAGGNFAFLDLPTGPWFAATEVAWAVNGWKQGGTLVKEAVTKDGEERSIMMTDSDLAYR